MSSIDELRNTEERYRLILESQNDLIYIINLKLGIEYINEPVFNRLLGYTVEDIKKNDVLFAVHPDDKKKALQAIKIGIKKGEGIVDLRIRDKKGDYHYHEFTGKLFTDFDGIQKALIISRDITEKKDFELKLKQSEENYRLITENANDLIGILNKDFIIEFANHQPCYNILGYKLDEVVGKNILDFVHPSDNERGFNSLLKALRRKEGIIEIRAKHKNGKYIWFEVKGKVFFDENNEPKGIIVCRDISSRKKAELELRDSEEMYRLITENANDVIGIVNRNLIFEFSNEHATFNILGYKSSEVIGKNVLDFLHPLDKDKGAKSLLRGLNEKEGINEIRSRHKNGKYIWLEVRGRVFIDKDGENKGILIGRDITSRKEAEMKLIESEAKYRLISENSNDLIRIFDRDLKFQYINASTHFIQLGYSKDELIGINAKKILHPEEYGEVDKFTQKLYETGEARREGRVLHKNGQWIWFDIWGKVIDSKNESWRGIIISRNITEKKVAEKSLLEEKVFIETALNSQRDTFFVFNPSSGEALLWNKTFSEVSGYSDEEIKGLKAPDSYYSEEDLEKASEAVKKALKNGKVIVEMVLITKDGQKIPYEYTGTTIQDSVGNILIVSIGRNITERIIAEKNLRESEEKYRKLFNNVSFAIILFNIEGTILDCNDKTKKITGYSKEELLGNNFRNFNFYVDIKTANLEERQRQIIAGKIPNVREIKLYKKDGSQFCAKTQIEFIKIGEERNIQAIIQDITEQKKIEKELSDLAKFPSENPNPVIRVNKQLILYINHTARDLFNLTEGDEIPVLLQTDVIKALDNNTTEIIEVKVNGAIYSFNIAPIKKEEYANIYGQDITERKNSELALNIEKKFTEDIIYSSQDTIFVFDLETGKALRWNKAFSKVSGYSDEEISSNKAPDSYYSKEDLKIATEAIQRLIEEGKTTLEMSFITKNGKKIPYEYKATTLKEPGGKISIVSIGRDITERNLAKQKLEESEQKYREAYDMANFYKDLFTHDMNNILQIINSSAEIISFQLGDSEKSLFIENMTHMIRSQIDRGAKLISDVRTLTSLDEEEISTHRIDISNFLNKSIKFVKKAYTQRKLSIISNDLDDKYYTNANELLQDVFDNILINATKYNENSVVELEIKISKHKIDKRDYVQIEFIDNGIGVTDMRKKLIFQPGHREIKGSKGMGIGLSLVSKIMDIFKGKIWVEDKVKGDFSQGSKFIVLLPKVKSI